MHHYIYHPKKGWLRTNGELNVSWVDTIWRATNYSKDDIGLALLMLGSDRYEVAILPDSRNTADWYTQPNLISIELSELQYIWIENRIRPHWDGIGNCSWFIEYGTHSYGPISPHPMGGFTLPFSGDADRYESVFMAAAVMLRGKLDLFLIDGFV